SLMGIHHLFDYDCRDLLPIEAEVRFQRNWVVGRTKNQPIRTIEVERDFKFPVTLEFVTAARQRSHDFKVRRRSKIVQSPSNQLGPLNIVRAHQTPEVAVSIAVIVALKYKVQVEAPTEMLTYGVNIIKPSLAVSTTVVGGEDARAPRVACVRRASPVKASTGRALRSPSE